MPESENTCINCSADISGKFCPECGQAAETKTVSWRGLFEEVYSTWLGMDNKFARTVKGLIVRPNQVIEEYLAGNRVKYIGPLSYLVVMSAVFILAFDLTGVTPREFMETTSSEFAAPPETDQQQEFMQSYLKWFSDNMRLLSGVMIPFLAMSMSIFYRGRNYLQNFLVVTYLTSQLLWLSVVSVIIFALFDLPIQLYLMVPTLIYSIWVIAKLNKRKNMFRSLGRALLTWLVGYALFLIGIFAVGVVAMIIHLSQNGGLG